MIVYDIGKLTDWLSSIGTLGAVIVALYLARVERKPKAKVSASFSFYADPINGVSSEPIVLTLGIVNQGIIPIHLSECTFQLSRRNKERAIFLDGNHIVNKLLSPGEYYEHSLEYGVIKALFKRKNKSRLKTVAYFADASGNKYKTKIKLVFS